MKPRSLPAAKAAGIPRSPFSFAQTESRSGEQPSVGRGGKPGKGVAKENTSNAADLRGEGERGQDKACVCVRAYACYTRPDMQACDLSAASW